MIEALKCSAGVMFWGLVNLVLASVWAALIGALIGGILKIIDRKDTND